MEIIPVVDLLGGQAVHARAGQRDRYAPLSSHLCPSSEPLEVVRGYLAVTRFQTLYIADLDAIGKRGDNGAIVRQIRAAFPELELWVDRGLAAEADCRAWLAQDQGRLVLGSESLGTPQVVERLSGAPEGAGFVLSLDFQGDRFLGPVALLDRPEIWPADIIVMTLARVGMAQGPDFSRLKAVARLAEGRRIHAAGGVRGAEDLERLATLGVSGVLMASALHDGRVGRREIKRLEARNRTPPAARSV